jgi:preprotein translocase subunit SecE
MKTAMMESDASSSSSPLVWWARGRTFLTQVRNELERVTWPTQREVYATTIVVVATSVIFGLYLWGIDLLLSQAVSWIFRMMGAGA